MNVIKKIIFFLKNKFLKKDEVKTLERPQKVEQNNYNNFTKSLQMEKSISNEEIKVLVCEGDGLGIQKKISF